MSATAKLTADQASVLHSLGYLYLEHGQKGRGLALLILADRCRPGVPTIMRSLVYAYLKNEEPGKALQVIDRLERILGVIQPASPLQLLRAQALWLSGRKGEARRVFGHFIQARAGAQHVNDRADELLLENGVSVS